MKKAGMFILNFFLIGVRFWVLLLLALLLLLIGAFWLKPCLYVGVALLAIHFLICLVMAIRTQRITLALSEDNPEFAAKMEQLSEDPHGFLADAMERHEQYRSLHGEELLALSDDDLFEAVFEQNLEISDGAEGSEVDAFTGARKTVFVLSLFDSEIQNGGLCQFFVNSSREAAPLVSESLAAVGAVQHQKLFDDFVAVNKINVCDLSSFQVYSRRGYIKQTKRFDFDSFDEAYYELPALQELVTAYIRANISEF